MVAAVSKALLGTHMCQQMSQSYKQWYLDNTLVSSEHRTYTCELKIKAVVTTRSPRLIITLVDLINGHKSLDKEKP